MLGFLRESNSPSGFVDHYYIATVDPEYRVTKDRLDAIVRK